MNDLKWRVADILNVIKKKPQFRTLLLEEADEILDDIYTFADTGCGKCKKEILKFIDSKPETINKVIEQYEAKNPKPSSVEKVMASASPEQPPQNERKAPNRVIGEVFEIEADPEAYKEFMLAAQSERWVFRGFNLVEKGDKWIILFY